MQNLVRRIYRHLFDATTPSSQCQIEAMADEIHSDVEFAESYGLSAHPPSEIADGLAVFVNGEPDHGMVLSWIDKTYRPADLSAGEVVLYSKFNQKIRLNDDGGILLTDSTGSTILMQDGKITVTPSGGITDFIGDIKATGNITAQNEVRDQNGTKSMSGMRSVYNTHQHGGSTVPNTSM